VTLPTVASARCVEDVPEVGAGTRAQDAVDERLQAPPLNVSDFFNHTTLMLLMMNHHAASSHLFLRIASER
jgi:hypothetical protein